MLKRITTILLAAAVLASLGVACRGQTAQVFWRTLKIWEPAGSPYNLFEGWVGGVLKFAVDPTGAITTGSIAGGGGASFGDQTFVVDPNATPSATVYNTIGAAITAITDASANKPYEVLITPGVYSESVSLPTTKSYVSLRGYGQATAWQPASGGGYNLRFEDNGATAATRGCSINGIGFRQRSDEQPVPMIMLGSVDNLAYGDESAFPDRVAPRDIAFANCDFNGILGPTVVGYGHEIHFQGCKFHANTLSNTYDVCLTDGAEENAPAWSSTSTYISSSARSAYARQSGRYGLTATITTGAAPRGSLGYLKIPYNNTTRTAGANVNTFSAWMKCDRTLDAGSFELAVVNNTSGTLGAGDANVIASVTIPELTTTWQHIIVPIAGCGGATVGSLVLMEIMATSVGYTLTLDDAWLQTGEYGLHETCVYKTLYPANLAPTGGYVAQNWLSFDGCVMESRTYLAAGSRVAGYSGHSWQIAVVESLDKQSGSSAGAQVAISGSRIYANAKRPADSITNFAPTYSGLGTVGASSVLSIAGSAIQLDAEGAAAGCYIYPMQLQQYASNTAGMANLTGNGWNTSTAVSATYPVVMYDTGSYFIPTYCDFSPVGILTAYIGTVAAGTPVTLFSSTNGLGAQAFKRWRIRRITLTGTKAATGTLTATPYREGVAMATTVIPDAGTGTLTQNTNYYSATGNEACFASTDDFGLTLVVGGVASSFTGVSVAIWYEALPL